MQKQELIELIKNRRSVYPRQYSGDKIPDEIVNEMLEVTNWAPTHKFTEPWRFKIFRGEALQKLVDFQQQLYLDTTPAEEVKEAKLKVFAETPQQTSHIIAIVRHINPIVPDMEEIASVAMAVQNFWLTVSAYGYGGYWSTGNGTFSPAMHNWLGLDENHTLMGFFYLGVPAEPMQPGKRKPWEEKIEWM